MCAYAYIHMCVRACVCVCVCVCDGNDHLLVLDLGDSKQKHPGKSSIYSRGMSHWQHCHTVTTNPTVAPHHLVCSGRTSPCEIPHMKRTECSKRSLLLWVRGYTAVITGLKCLPLTRSWSCMADQSPSSSQRLGVHTHLVNKHCIPLARVLKGCAVSGETTPTPASADATPHCLIYTSILTCCLTSGSLQKEVEMAKKARVKVAMSSYILGYGAFHSIQPLWRFLKG